MRIINLLDDGTNEPSKFRTRNWVEVNDESRRTYTETWMRRSNLCDYIGVYIYVKGTITHKAQLQIIEIRR